MKLAGSAGIFIFDTLVSAVITPTGIPPKRALPQIAVGAQSLIISHQLFSSKKPLSQSFNEFTCPENINLGSYGDFGGK